MGFFYDLGGSIKARLNLKTTAAEVLETITGRLIPQGAAEIAQALYTQGAAYVPYGPGQEAMPVEPGEAIGPAIEPQAASTEAVTVAPALSTQEQYQANLAMYAGRSAPGQDQTRCL